MMPAMRIGVVGCRSWIAKAIIRELRESGHTVVELAKADLGGQDLGDLRCVVAVLGRANPTPDEARLEREQLSALLWNPSRGQVIYLSSRRQTQSKVWCEQQCKWHCGQTGQATIVRPPAVFGPEQDIDSPMLVPSLASTNGSLDLRTPWAEADFIYVHDLALHIKGIIEHGKNPSPDDMIEGEFTLTPMQMARLYETWWALRRGMRPADHDPYEPFLERT